MLVIPSLFHNVQHGEVHEIFFKDKGSIVEIYTVVDGETLYFVPISSIKGVKCDDGFGVCQQIVASPISSIQDKKTFLWITEEVTDRVNPNPVKENN